MTIPYRAQMQVGGSQLANPIFIVNAGLEVGLCFRLRPKGHRKKFAGDIWGEKILFFFNPNVLSLGIVVSQWDTRNGCGCPGATLRFQGQQGRKMERI